MNLCPICEATLTTPLVCLNCDALLPTEGKTISPFEALGVERRWEMDRKQLKRALLDLSRRVHPDYFATAEPQQRELAEVASAALNEAFETLSDDPRRADWLVRALGGPSESEERQMPQAFLMQVLEWNEVLEEARAATAGTPEWQTMLELGTELSGEREERLEAIGALLAPLPEAGAESLIQVRRELNAVRYIDRTRAELKSLRLEAALGGA